MRGIVALVAVGTLVSGCAVSRVPSLSFLGGDSAKQETTTANLAPGSAPSSAPSAGTGSLWDNFSAPFRGSSAPTRVALTSPQQVNPEAALRLVNDFRSQKGLRPLRLEPRLNKAAALLAGDMSKHDRMSHYGPNGAGIEQRLTTVGYDYSVAAENIGVGQQTVEEMVEGWKKSPSHAKNMLLPEARDIGIAMTQRPDSRFKTFWTLVVGAPAQ